MEDISEFEIARQLMTAQIACAFYAASRDDGITLHEADIIDSCGTLNVDRTSEGFQAARQLDRENFWHEVPSHVIAELYSVLCFLDAKGFRFYIPAYMVWTLENFRASDSPTSSYTISALDPGEVFEDWQWRHPRLQELDEQQRSTIKEFLRFMAHHGDEFDRDKARDALKNWSAYEVFRINVMK